MNTRHANLATFAKCALSRIAPIAPITPDVAAALPGGEQAEEDDEEWLEFLSLGARIDLPDRTVGSGWRHAPVLLSY